MMVEHSTLYGLILEEEEFIELIKDKGKLTALTYRKKDIIEENEFLDLQLFNEYTLHSIEYNIKVLCEYYNYDKKEAKIKVLEKYLEGFKEEIENKDNDQLIEPPIKD